mmetsp:Transcript_92004/g.265460  ORF Transcript_92004/g.265460 Transcript_92004/m.265460 type:complete len:245 (+) Transcript_92004:837-1571(+)
MLLAIGVVLRALNLALLALLHPRQSLLASLAYGPQGLRAQRVLETGPLLNNRTARRQRSHINQHLVAHPWVLPAGPLFDHRLDHTLVSEEIVLRRPTDQLHLEDQTRIRRDLWRGARLAIGELRCQRELGNLPLLHRRNAQVPALDHLALAQCEDKRLPPPPRRVELRAIRGQGPHVVHGNLVSALGRLPIHALRLPHNLFLHTLRQRGRLRDARPHAIVVEVRHAIHTHVHVASGGHLVVRHA